MKSCVILSASSADARTIWKTLRYSRIERHGRNYWRKLNDKEQRQWHRSCGNRFVLFREGVTQAMERDIVQIEATTAVICNTNGNIVENGLRRVCPHCQSVYLFQSGHQAIEIWRVGASGLWECTKCRKRHHSLTLSVPQNMSPKELYRTIFPEGATEPTAIRELPTPKIRQKRALNSPQLSLFD